MQCLKCQSDNPDGKKYCGDCGTPLDPIIGQFQKHIKEVVQGEVENTIQTRYRDQKLVEIETSQAIVERVQKWSKIFGGFVGIPLAIMLVLLGFFGIRSYQDLSKLIESQEKNIKINLAEAQKDAKLARDNAKEASKQVTDLSKLAEQTSQEFSTQANQIEQKIGELSKLNVEIESIKNEAVKTKERLKEVSALSSEIEGLTSKVNRIEREVFNFGRLSFVIESNKSIESLTKYLEKLGAEISFLQVDELSEISITNPDIIIIGDDTEAAWKEQSPIILKKIFENYKVVGMGDGGCELFGVLGLEIGGEHTMHGSDSTILVEVPQLLEMPHAISSSDKTITVYKHANVRGVHDDGSPIIAGFEGIGRSKGSRNHWPIARQGNFLLWGFHAPVDEMTEAGKQLFVNLLMNHKVKPAISLSQARKRVDYIKPGIISERLTSQFSGHTWHLKMEKKGNIKAVLSWEPSDSPLALILNGPGRLGYFARKDGRSPLSIKFNVEEAQIRKGSEWRISIKSFRKLGKIRINYQLKLSFP